MALDDDSIDQCDDVRFWQLIQKRNEKMKNISNVDDF